MAKDIVTIDFDYELSPGRTGQVILDPNSNVGISNTSKIKGSKVLTSQRTFMIVGYTGGRVANGSGTSSVFTVSRQAHFTKADNDFVMLDGDSIQNIIISGVDGEGVPTSDSTQVTIKAKQHTVKGS